MNNNNKKVFFPAIKIIPLLSYYLLCLDSSLVFSTSYYPKHKLCSQNKTKKAAFCVKKKHFGTNNVAGFSNSFQTNSIFHYNRNFFDPGMENILSQGWKTFFPRDGKLVLILSFSLFFHFSKRERGKKPLDWFTKPVMDNFTFVNRIATELVK